MVMLTIQGEWMLWCQEQGTTLFAGSSSDKVGDSYSLVE